MELRRNPMNPEIHSAVLKLSLEVDACDPSIVYDASVAVLLR